MDTRSTVTNERVAQDLGVTHSMVSRIRSGDRHPSLDVMIKIAEVFGWTVDDQAYARSYGFYASQFEASIRKHYV